MQGSADTKVIVNPMSFSPLRFLIFSFIGLPIGFILTALAFAVSEQPIVAAQIFPWALGLAAMVGIVGALWKPKG